MYPIIDQDRVHQIWTTIGKIILGLIISGLLTWLVINGLNWAIVKVTILSLNIPLLLVSILVFLINNYIRAFRWQVLLLNENVSVHRLFIVENEGLGLNNLMPIRIAAEAIQWTALTVNNNVRGSFALATLGMVRVLDLIANILILTIGFIFIPEMDEFRFYIIGISIFGLVSISLITFMLWSQNNLPLINQIPGLKSFISSVASLTNSPSRLWLSLLISLIYWMIIGLTVWLIALSLNIPVSLLAATIIVIGTIFFATAIPSAPSSIGTFEAVMIYMLSIFGLESESSFSYAVIVHLVLFLPPSIIALIFLPSEGIGAFTKIRSLIGQFNRIAKTSK